MTHQDLRHQQQRLHKMSTKPKSKGHCQTQVSVGDHPHRNPSLTQEEELHFSIMRLKQQRWAQDSAKGLNINGNIVKTVKSYKLFGGIFGDGGMQAHANGS